MKMLQIVKSENFGAVQCDFYKGENNEILMTRRQIGEALEYENPNGSVKNIHLRHSDRLDEFSTVVQIDTPSRGKQETTVYNAKGVMEICRWSQQPKADQFMDWVWDVLNSLRTGQATLVPTGVQAIKLVNQQVGMLVGEVEQIQSRVSNLEDNMTIDFGQQKVLGDIARRKAVEALGGKNTPAYRDKGIRTKVFSKVWKDYKDYFEINSYRDTPKLDFNKAKNHLLNWQPQGKLLKEIDDCNSQIKFQEVS